MNLLRTDHFLYAFFVLAGQMVFLKVVGQQIYRVFFDEPFLFSNSLFRLLARGDLSKRMAFALSWKLFGGYFLIAAVFTLSGSALASFVAEEFTRTVVTDAYRQIYISTSFVIGTVLASCTRVLPRDVSRSMVHSIFYQVIIMVTAFLLFWGGRVELTTAEIFRPIFATLKELARMKFFVIGPMFLIGALATTEAAVLIRPSR